MLPICQAELTRREYSEDFERFYGRAWREIDGAPLVWGWFPALLCAELERWGRGETRNLIVAVPPGSSKSLSASVILPAWMWLRDPSCQFLCCGHGAELTTRDNTRMRTLVSSEWYRDLVAGAWGFSEDQNQKTRFQNTRKGLRQGVGGKSGLTGWRGDHVIIDDPVDANPRKPPREEDLELAYQWVQYIRRTRVNDPKTARTLMIMQRIHEDDPVGRLLEEEPGEWDTVCFDMEYDSRMPFRHSKDPRRTEGELLFPERFGPVEISQRKRAQGSNYSAQNQQMPAAPKGMIIETDWIRDIAEPKPEQDYQYIVQSWDLAFKGEATSSWVTGATWGIDSPDSPDFRRFDLLDVVREQATYVRSKQLIRLAALLHPTVSCILIEDKANGPAAINELKSEFPAICPFSPNPYGNKPQRLRTVAPLFERGQISIGNGDWRAAYISELTKAPSVKHWDQVDVTTQAIIAAIEGKVTAHVKALKRQAVKGLVLGGWG